MKNEWILVKEKLPEIEKEVLVTDEYGSIEIAFLTYSPWTEEEVLEWQRYSNFTLDPIAWMPLPEPHGGEKND